MITGSVWPSISIICEFNGRKRVVDGEYQLTRSHERHDERGRNNLQILSRNAERRSLREIVINEGCRPEGAPEDQLKLLKIGVDARLEGFFHCVSLSWLLTCFF